MNARAPPYPFGPSEVTLARTPGAGFMFPPNPKDVTEGATPFTCAAATTAANTTSGKNANLNRALTVMGCLPRPA
jgi:hypothetical protein